MENSNVDFGNSNKSNSGRYKRKVYFSLLTAGVIITSIIVFYSMNKKIYLHLSDDTFNIKYLNYEQKILKQGVRFIPSHDCFLLKREENCILFFRTPC